MNFEAVAEHIITWIHNYAQNAKVNGLVVGISGGIDSALTSTLCAKTGLPVSVLSMPIHQESSQLSRAHNHIKWLTSNFENVTDYEVNLTESFENFKKALPEDIRANAMSMANTRARLRMSTLYAFAQSQGRLVAGTGNKVEDFGVGFYTKYGDGGVDLSPIADLYKTEVFGLAKHLGVNEEILNAQPTDGLWDDNRNDEDQLGATYPELEWAMEYLNSDKPSDAISDREKEVLEIYHKFHNQNKHKMIPIPVCSIPASLKTH